MLTMSSLSRQRRVDSHFLSKHGALLDVALRLSDVLVIVVVAFVTHWLQAGDYGLRDPYPAGLVRTVLLTLLVFPAIGLYRSWRGERPGAEIVRLWAAWLAVMLLLLALEWASRTTGEYSRQGAAVWFVVTGVVLSIDRLVMRWALGRFRTRGIDARRVLLVGATQAGQRIVTAARKNPWMGLTVVGYLRTPYDHQDIQGAPCLGDFDSLGEGCESWSLDQVWIALPLRAETMIQRVLQMTLDKPTIVRLVPDFFGYEMINHHAALLAGVPVITLRGSRVDGHAGLVKALEDRLVALMLLLLLGPVMVAIAIGVKWSSPGPVIYRQKRHGLGGKEFDVWKFRSMRVHVEQVGAVTQATRGDSRVTRFGRFLRATSLDELPQLINVLKGNMSIVGPRPHAVEHNHHFSECLRGYMQRHGVKPGMTGLAQIRGFRGETDTLEKMAQRVECDISYIREWSLWLDLKIILFTPFVLLKRTNAY